MKMNEYLLKVKKIIDNLSSIGSPITSTDHIKALLEGLPHYYNSFIVLITSRTDPYTTTEIESLLLAQEERIEKYKKELHTVTNMTANLAQTQDKSPKSNA